MLLVSNSELETEVAWILFFFFLLTDMGVLVGKGGFYGNVFRVTPPLCFTKEDSGNICC
jgi:hypothetical protein